MRCIICGGENMFVRVTEDGEKEHCVKCQREATESTPLNADYAQLQAWRLQHNKDRDIHPPPSPPNID